MVLLSTKVHVSARQPRKIIYRTYKKFDAEKYKYDLSCTPFYLGGIFDSIEHSYWYCETFLNGIINEYHYEHAPLKCTIVRHNQVLCINGQLVIVGFDHLHSAALYVLDASFNMYNCTIIARIWLYSRLKSVTCM